MAADAPGVGIDLIEVDRLERALTRRPRLRERIFTPGELEFADARARPARHLAARFAAKEAALKALGIGGLGLRHIEVIGGGDSPPQLRLHGPVAEARHRAGVTLDLSLTHGRELAAAVVVARSA